MSAEPARTPCPTTATPTFEPTELTGRWVYLRDTGAGVLTRVERTGAHWEWELRTPEGTVTGSGYPQAAPLSRYARPETRRARRVLRALRAGEIIRRLRELVRKAEPHRVPVSVNTLVHEVANLLESEVREHGVAVDLILQPDLPAVVGDAVEIEQVLINLARNALEAMHESPGGAPKLAFETRQHGVRDVEVIVRDTGPGLANGTATIFEPIGGRSTNSCRYAVKATVSVATEPLPITKNSAQP